MKFIRERIVGTALMLLLEIIAAAALLLAGVEDIFTAVILATPATTPAFVYRVYAEVPFFEDERMRAETSIVHRGLHLTASAVLAGFIAVPVGLGVYRFFPVGSMDARFALGFWIAMLLVFLVGSLTAVLLNNEYLVGEWEDGSMGARLLERLGSEE